MRKFISLVLLFVLSSCNVKIPILVNESYSGITQTCVTDTSAFMQADVVRFKTMLRSDKSPLNRYMGCMNVPEYFDKMPFWPSKLWLDFKTNKYMFSYPNDPKLDEKQYVQYSYMLEYGKFTINKTCSIITFKSDKCKWEKTFHIQ